LKDPALLKREAGFLNAFHLGNLLIRVGSFLALLHNHDTAGLARVTGRESDKGRVKEPSLRNVAITTPYFHNGAIATLKEAAHFYNVRDVEPSIPQAEFPQTMNVVELAALGLTNQDQDDIVAFLGILTDGYLVE